MYTIASLIESYDLWNWEIHTRVDALEPQITSE